MSYGLTFDNVRTINRPTPERLPWGTITPCTNVPQYSLYRLELTPGAAQPLHLHTCRASRVFVETGAVVLRRLDPDANEIVGTVRAGQIVSLRDLEAHAFSSAGGAVLYMFGPRSEGPCRLVPVQSHHAAAEAMARFNGSRLPNVGASTTDVRQKYWGRIETILDGDVAGKRIFVNKGCQSSLEFHVEKHETYFIHSGLLRLGLRVGRAENRSIVLGAGDSYDVRPGVMHMRMALEDTVIIEVSTRDQDADSFIVEDGQSYTHIDAKPAAAE